MQHQTFVFWNDYAFSFSMNSRDTSENDLQPRNRFETLVLVWPIVP
jgi:hypothetical protein